MNTEPVLLTGPRQKDLIDFNMAVVKTALDIELHPVFLFTIQGNKNYTYIENDEQTIIITVERRQKRRMGITKKDIIQKS